MKYLINKEFLSSLLLCSLGLAVIGLGSSANPPQTPTKQPTQQGYGRAPLPPEAQTPTKQPTQQGYGRAPLPPEAQTPTKQPTQQGYGRAPYPPQDKIEVYR